MKYIILFALLLFISYVFFLNLKAKQQDPKIKYVKRLPKPRSGITIPPFGVYIKEDMKGKIEEHELCHWKQYQERGLSKFYYDYFRNLAKYGYEENPMEKECSVA